VLRRFVVPQKEETANDVLHGKQVGSKTKGGNDILHPSIEIFYKH